MTPDPIPPPAPVENSSPKGNNASPTSWTRRLLNWMGFTFGSLLLLFVIYRWLGTSTVRGTVQRVYEKDARFLIEFVDASGNVTVVENEPIRFPHFKASTEDLHADLHRYSQTGDIVDLTTWGIRASFMDVFPNAVDVDFVKSNQAAKQLQAERIARLVINELLDQGVLRRGDASEETRRKISHVIEKALITPASDEEKSPPAHP
jgi:hypothetical protein